MSAGNNITEISIVPQLGKGVFSWLVVIVAEIKKRFKNRQKSVQLFIPGKDKVHEFGGKGR
jgi:hypothetical protein